MSNQKSPNTVVSELEGILSDPERVKYYMTGHGTQYQAAVEHFHEHFFEEPFEAFFSAVWVPHIGEKVRAMDAKSEKSMTLADATHYAETAHMVVASAEYVQMWEAIHMDTEGIWCPRGFPPKVMPASTLRGELGFDDGRMEELQHALLIVPSAYAARQLSRQRTVSDYVDAAHQESARLRKQRAELVGLASD